MLVLPRRWSGPRVALAALGAPPARRRGRPGPLTGEPRRAPRGRSGRAPPGRPRYSLLVGLVFVAVDHRSRRSTPCTRRGRAARDRGAPRRPPLAEFAVPTPAGAGGRRQHLPGRLRDVGDPVSRRSAAHPACEIGPERDPGLRPLRPAAGDLVLVHRGRRLPADAGRLRRGRPALSRPRQLPLDRRPRRPRRGARPSPSAAGRSRSAGTATAPSRNLYRVGGCPTVAFAYPGGILADADREPTSCRTRARRRRRGSDRRARADAAPSRERQAGEPSDAVSEVAPSRAGSCAGAAPRSSPASRCATCVVERGSGRTPEELKERLAELSEPLRRRPGDQPAPSADPVGLPGLLPPHRPRPRRAADPGRAARARADASAAASQPEPARRRADDRDHRVRRRAARVRRRPGRGRARDPRQRRRRGARGPPGRAAERDARDRRRGAPARAAVRRHRGGPRRAPEDQAHAALRVPVSRACPRSPSRRRCGWPSEAMLALNWPYQVDGGVTEEPRARVDRADPTRAVVPERRLEPASARRRAPTRRARTSAARSPRSSRARRALRLRLPAPGIEWGVGAVGGPRVLSVRRARAGPRRARAPAARRPRRARPPRRRRGGKPRPDRADDRRPRAPPLAPDLQRGHRRARLPALALAPALGHPRDAARLVAGQALLGLSVSRGAGAPAEAGTPRKTEAVVTMSKATRKRRKRGPKRQRSETGERARGRRPIPTTAGARAPPARAPKAALYRGRRPPAPWGIVPARRSSSSWSALVLLVRLLRRGAARNDADRHRPRARLAGRPGALDP